MSVSNAVDVKFRAALAIIKNYVKDTREDEKPFYFDKQQEEWLYAAIKFNHENQYRLNIVDTVLLTLHDMGFITEGEGNAITIIMVKPGGKE